MIELKTVIIFLGVIGGGVGALRAEANALPKGVGPVKTLTLDPLDNTLAMKGKEIFSGKCSACHKMEERYVGPGLKGITQRRSPEWVMNMILNPQEMIQKDEEAQKLMEEYLVQMPFQNVTTEETRAILEYFRHFDEKGEVASKSEKPGKKEPAKKTKN